MFDERKARLIAFYLPQFHPIPENDAWWTRGFTEWTNVAAARPLFKGHQQPNYPADLGFYDLRVPEARAAQAKLAQEHGIEGFCYWHYWFAGRRLLERPFREVLNSGEPKFPFCLAWANESWTGIWNGEPNKILLEQTYPGNDDYVRHFHAVVDAFGDDRYIQIDGKPLFVVYMPDSLPDPERFTDLWNELALKAGLRGMYFVGIVDSPWSETRGFDGYTYHLPGTFLKALPQRKLNRLVKKIHATSTGGAARRHARSPLQVNYAALTANVFNSMSFGAKHYPSILPNWDSTPRHGVKGLAVTDSSPELFRQHLRAAISIVAAREPDRRVVFVKSWNEWAEGNYLEPDTRFGLSYLQVIQQELLRARAKVEVGFPTTGQGIAIDLPARQEALLAD
ncbi:MAG TPA: glycoside hydrolase family 99-like domain-containing protein [Pyrinomonadaceae bacterium]|nr:glycoside hydrolase family 99-like domain-containing protein [Pyrinomonadaceae bacterium]